MLDSERFPVQLLDSWALDPGSSLPTFKTLKGKKSVLLVPTSRKDQF